MGLFEWCLFSMNCLFLLYLLGYNGTCNGMNGMEWIPKPRLAINPFTGKFVIGTDRIIEEQDNLEAVGSGHFLPRGPGQRERHSVAETDSERCARKRLCKRELSCFFQGLQSLDLFPRSGGNLALKTQGPSNKISLCLR